MKKVLLKGIILFFIGVLGSTAQAQSAKRADKMVQRRQEQLDKQKKEKEKEAYNELEIRKRKHFDMQTKKVQKRMKKSQKKSKRYNENRKEFFIKRWFSRR